MTKSCRGLGTTAPYLSLGEPATIEGFADNIVDDARAGRRARRRRLRQVPGHAARARGQRVGTRHAVAGGAAGGAGRVHGAHPARAVAVRRARAARAGSRRARRPGAVSRPLRRLPPAGRRLGARRSDTGAPARTAPARGRGRPDRPAPARGGDADPGQRGQQPTVAARGLGSGALLQRRQRAHPGGAAAPDQSRRAARACAGERHAPTGLHAAEQAALLAFLRAL